MTASRPTRWRTSCGGTLPLRNPGIRISLAYCLAAAARLASTSSVETVAAIFTRDSGSSVISVWTLIGRGA